MILDQRIPIPFQPLFGGDEEPPLPGLQRSFDQKLRDLLRGRKPQDPHVLVTLLPTRSSVRKVGIRGMDKSKIRLVDDFVLAVPLEELGQAIEAGGFLAETDLQSTGVLDIAGIVDGRTLRDFPESQELGNADLPVDYPGAAERIRMIGRQSLIGSSILLLSERFALARKESDDTLRDLRHLFVALDFVTLPGILNKRSGETSVQELFEVATRGLVSPGGATQDDVAAWIASSTDERLESVLGFFIQKRDAQRFLAPLAKTLGAGIQARMQNAQANPPLATKWSGSVYFPQQYGGFEDAVKETHAYFHDALEILFPPSAPAWGLKQEDDLIRFAKGELGLFEYQEPSAGGAPSFKRNEILNAEPDGGLFFAFAEMFLLRRSLGDLSPEEDAALVHDIRVALLAERVYVEYYKVASANELGLHNYHFAHGPIAGRGQGSFLDDAKALVPDATASTQTLLDAHQALLHEAKQPHPVEA